MPDPEEAGDSVMHTLPPACSAVPSTEISDASVVRDMTPLSQTRLKEERRPATADRLPIGYPGALILLTPKKGGNLELVAFCVILEQIDFFLLLSR